MTAYNDARARLPKDVVELCDAAIAEFRAYWALRAAGEVKGHEHHKSNAACAAMETALKRVGVGTQEARSRPMSSVTSEQRDVITILSEDEIPIDPLTPVRGNARRRRRVLGIEPGGVLEELVDGRPRWELYENTALVDGQEPNTGLPDERRIEALVEGILGGYPGRYSEQLERLLDTHSQYAGAYAARTLSSLRNEESYYLYWLSAALFTLLARSGTPTPEGVDWLFPIATHGQLPIPVDRVIEHTMALPPGRRERVLVAAVWRSDGRFSEVLAAIVAVLDAQPMPTVLDEALRYAATKKKETKDARTRQDLVAMEKKLLAMQKGKSAPRASAKRMVLKVESVHSPTSVDELDAIRKEQLRIAGDLWEGVERPAERRLGTDESDESSFGGLCEWRVLSHGARRIDAWLYGGDSGTYFEGGTLERIGEMIQRSVATIREADASTGLDLALEVASSTAAGRRTTAKKAKAPKAAKQPKRLP